jgi:hypothetical protein
MQDTLNEPTLGESINAATAAIKAFGDVLRIKMWLMRNRSYPTHGDSYNGIANSKHKPRQVRMRGK